MPLGKEVGGHIVLDEDPAPHSSWAAPPHFQPMPIVAKQSPISATAELLSTEWIGKSICSYKISGRHMKQCYGHTRLCNSDHFKTWLSRDHPLIFCLYQNNCQPQAEKKFRLSHHGFCCAPGQKNQLSQWFNFSCRLIANLFGRLFLAS